MNKERIGIELSKIRDGRKVNSITEYAVKSIEDARSSYPVSNLMAYCNELGISVTIVDKATEDTFAIHDMVEMHSTIQMLMKRYQVDDKMIYRQSGIHYTAPKGNTGSLSILTLLAIADVVHFDVVFE